MSTENHSRNDAMELVSVEVMHLDGVILDELTHLSLADLCRACATHAERILALVEEGILTPEETPPHGWRFTGQQLRRAQVALRLQNDLGVNLAGAALAVQLIEERDALREQLQRLDADRRRIEIHDLF